MMQVLSKYSTKKPMTVVVAVIAVIILGVVSVINMTVDLLPSMDLPYVVVYSSYPGASPEKVETALTEPLESALATTSGLNNIQSISSENVGILILEFAYSTNMDAAMIEMDSAIDLIEPYLDEMISTPTMIRINPDMLPVVMSSVDFEGMDAAELSVFLDETVVPALERVEGVASVSTSGQVENSLTVTISSEKLDALNEKIAGELEDTFAETDRMLGAAGAQINEAFAQIDAKEKEFNDSAAALEDGLAQIDAAIASMPSRDELDASKAGLEMAIAGLEQLIAAAEQTGDAEQVAALTAQKAGYEENLAAVVGAISTLDALEAQRAELAAAKGQLDASEETVRAQLDDARDQLSSARGSIGSYRRQLAEAKEQALEQADVSSFVTADMVSAILAADNFSMPAGYITVGDEQVIVKVGDQFVSLEELEQLKLVEMDFDSVSSITLGDVADIELGVLESESFARINGAPGIILSVEKSSTSSTVEVAHRVEDACLELERQYEGLHINALSDQGEYIDIVIESVLQNLIMGGLLAVIVLLIFLRNIRPTLVIAVSIPVSIMFAIVLMYFSDVTLNLISLAGLAMGVGMLVDNSIVVIENIFRLRAQGVKPFEAAVKGASQVAGAITASTLTTICVFLPIVFTEGLSRQLFTDMGLTIAYSLVASLIVALTVVPAMSRPMLESYVEKRGKVFDGFVGAYRKAISFVLRFKLPVIACAVVLLVVAAYGAFTSGLAFIPASESYQITATVSLEGEYTQDELYEMSGEVADRILEIDGVELVGEMSGAGGMMSMMGGGSDGISLYIVLDENSGVSSNAVTEEIISRTQDLDCELEVNGATMDISALTGSGITVYVKGDNLDDMRSAAYDIADMLSSLEGTVEVTDLDAESTPELRVSVDKSKALEYGLTVAQVYQQVAELLTESSSVTTITIDSVDYPVTVVDDSAEPADVESLTDKVVATYTDDEGEEHEVTLGEIAQITEEKSAASIFRSNQVRYITVSAGVDEEHNVSLVSRELESLLDDYTPPKGITIELSGENESIMETIGDLLIMILLAVVLIYLIMVAQFQSLRSPFIVIFTIPLAFTGGLLALMIFGMEISVISMLGFLVLAGIIVNNGIVLVDYVNQLREEGVPMREALIEAGCARLRPILMTTITTVLGLVTLAFGVGTGADMLQSLAVVIIGGLIYATVMTLFIVPSLYELMHGKKKTNRKDETPALPEAEPQPEAETEAPQEV